MRCPIEYTLTPEEMAVCEVWAKAYILFREENKDDAALAERLASELQDREFKVLTVERQMDGKAAEVAVCKLLGLPINTTLEWRVDVVGDPGHDLVSRGKKIDVKSMKPRSHYCLWPINKNDRFESKDFDILIWTRGEGRHWEVLGWITKEDFFEKKQVAPKGHKLAEGTWFIDYHDGHLNTSWRRA